MWSLRDAPDSSVYEKSRVVSKNAQQSHAGPFWEAGRGLRSYQLPRIE